MAAADDIERIAARILRRQDLSVDELTARVKRACAAQGIPRNPLTFGRSIAAAVAWRRP
jgi:hypothetical protein